MFGKLMKHEWRATVMAQGGLCAAILSLGLLGAVNVAIIYKKAEQISNLAMGSLSLSLLFINLAILLCAAASGILLLVRFYKSRFTDQGYLTFTLPVTVHQNFLSAFLNMLRWQVLVFVALVLAYGFMALGIYLAIGRETFREFYEPLRLLFAEEMNDVLQSMAMLVPAYVLQLIVGVVYNTMIALTCLTLGATLAKKHKILAAIGVYYLISTATGMVGNALTMSVTLRLEEVLQGTEVEALRQVMQQLLTVTLPLQLLVIGLCYVLATTFMKKKLNLN